MQSSPWTLGPRVWAENLEHTRVWAGVSLEFPQRLRHPSPKATHSIHGSTTNSDGSSSPVTCLQPARAGPCKSKLVWTPMGSRPGTTNMQAHGRQAAAQLRPSMWHRRRPCPAPGPQFHRDMLGVGVGVVVGRQPWDAKAKQRKGPPIRYFSRANIRAEFCRKWHL